MLSLEDLGWDSSFADALARLASAGFVPAGAAPLRVVAEHRTLVHAAGAHGELVARLSGVLRHRIATAGHDRPAVGDWVVAVPRLEEGTATVHGVLPRRTVLARRQAGDETAAQVLAANLDYVLVVTACDRDFNPRRLERLVALVWEGGAQPVIVLSKADLVPDVEPLREEAEGSSPGVPVVALSATHGDGLAGLEPFLRRGRTLALVGASGVGKSTLANRLLGAERLAAGEVRGKDSKGRHTTTHRQLVALPGGALAIDTPGLREVALWDAAEGLEATFAEVEALASACRFTNCAHEHEPGCAVRAAIDSGAVAPERVASYQKLRRELAYLERRKDVAAQRAQERRFGRMSRTVQKETRRRKG